MQIVNQKTGNVFEFIYGSVVHDNRKYFSEDEQYFLDSQDKIFVDKLRSNMYLFDEFYNMAKSSHTGTVKNIFIPVCEDMNSVYFRRISLYDASVINDVKHNGVICIVNEIHINKETETLPIKRKSHLHIVK